MEKSLGAVVFLLSIAFLACLAVMWVIVYRLRGFLRSTGYKFIFAAKMCFAILCGSGVYLILYPLPKRVILVQVSWFSLLAIGCLCSAVGFYLYSRDVNAVLRLKEKEDHNTLAPEGETHANGQ